MAARDGCQMSNLSQIPMDNPCCSCKLTAAVGMLSDLAEHDSIHELVHNVIEGCQMAEHE